MNPRDLLIVFGSVQRVMRAALPHFRAQGRGTILYTSSLIGRIATPFYGTYSASKWALEAIVECYRTELSGFGVESCIIEPGAMPTAFFDGMVMPNDPAREAGYGDFAAVPKLSAQGLAQMLDATPDQRPDRIAEAVAALLALPFGQKPFRTVVDHTGVGPEIERYNTADAYVIGAPNYFAMLNGITHCFLERWYQFRHRECKAVAGKLGVAVGGIILTKGVAPPLGGIYNFLVFGDRDVAWERFL